LKFHCRGFERFQAGDLLVPQEIQFTDHNGTIGDGAQRSARRDRLRIFHSLENDTLFLRALHNRGGERVFAVLLQ